ncbi:hypothetical protein [Brevundimonas sp.]|uniref:hypothetical protein n=1 Tax=Brevundimonas sp. TaxID=1871086 RepID=UPI00286A2EBB|nr:hypothetical protein [Brevundimonas sp.]
MKLAAFVAWGLAVLDLLATFWLSPASITTSEVTSDGSEVNSSTEVLSFFDTMTMPGALMFFGIFMLIIVGCVFWCGAAVEKAIKQG